VDTDRGDSATKDEASVSVKVMTFMEAQFAVVDDKLSAIDRHLKKIEEWVDGQWTGDN
ncbi:hypothetical protein ACLOJK_029292, partial [Asimina triloba]